MKKFAFASLAIATALAITPAAMADPVSGSIAISGNNVDTFNATAITFSSTGTASGSGGSLATVSGSATLTGFTYTSSDGVELFDVTTGPDVPVTFTITGPVVATLMDGGDSINITGSGFFNEAGFAQTDGTFILNSSNSGSTSLQLTADVPAATPEPSSLLLLGTGLLGMALVLFRKSKPAASLRLNM